jgi:hypothetical protein
MDTIRPVFVPYRCDELAHGRALFRHYPIATREVIHESSEHACSAVCPRGQATAAHYLQEFPARLAGPVQSATCHPGTRLREGRQPDRTQLTGRRSINPYRWLPAVMSMAAAPLVLQTIERGLLCLSD